MLRRAFPHLVWLTSVALTAGLITSHALAQGTADSTASADTTSTRSVPATEPPTASEAAGPADSVAVRHEPGLERALADQGFQNVTVDRLAGRLDVAFENRRYRHSGRALGIASSVVREPALFFERRLGMEAAAVADSAGALTHVMYPSDGSFPPRPTGSRIAPTRNSVDLLIRPLFTYELGRIFDPVLIRVEVEPELRYNPWPGGLLRAGLIFPVRNDFETDSLHPDLNRVRPGPVQFQQFGWAPGAALLSGTGGLLGNNRYGVSFGVARPLAGGSFLLDGQVDITGFIAFADSGVTYSTPSLWTAFAGVTYHPPRVDLAIRARVAKFLFSDDGVELEVKRSLGDLDIAYYIQRTHSEDWFTVGGIRLQIPIPPMTRPVRPTVRVLPVDRFPLEYSDEASPVGRFISNVASREDYLRQLNPSSLSDYAKRYQDGKRAQRDPPPTMTLLGSSGFVITPWCGTLEDGQLEVGFNTIPKPVSYITTGPDVKFRNDAYYAAMGFLPHIETTFRWVIAPGSRAFADLVPESKLTDSDRSVSARWEVIPPRPNRPGLALGVDDAKGGSRRLHSTYAVLGIPVVIYQLQNRLSLGYAPRVFTASRRLLDGVFGAVEVSPWRFVAASLEQDTEKWNAMLGFSLGFGLRGRVAMLDLEHANSKRIGFGAGWTHTL